MSPPSPAGLEQPLPSPHTRPHSTTLSEAPLDTLTPCTVLAPAEAVPSLGVVRNAEFCAYPRPAQGEPAF